MSSPSRTPNEPQSLGQLVSSMTSSVSSLIRLEIELVKAEMREQAKAGGMGAGMLLFAGVLAFVAFLMLSVAAALGIAEALPGWAGFLIVGGVYLLVTVLLGFLGVRRLQKVKGPERAQKMAAETGAMLKDRSGQIQEALTEGRPVSAVHEQRERTAELAVAPSPAPQPLPRPPGPDTPPTGP